MKKTLFLASLCALTLGSCTKDYKKMVLEYERSLPDSVYVAFEKIDDTEHSLYVVYNNSIYRHDLDDNSNNLIEPLLEKNEYVNSVYPGTGHIAFITNDENLSSSKLFVYNIDTRRFMKVTDFTGTVNDDVLVSETDGTISGYIPDSPITYTRVYFDFDGNRIKEEQEDDPNLGDFDVPDDPGYYYGYYNGNDNRQKEPFEEFICKNCGKRIYARNKAEADSKTGSCTYTVHRDDGISTSSGSTYTYTGGGHEWY